MLMELSGKNEESCEKREGDLEGDGGRRGEVGGTMDGMHFSIAYVRRRRVMQQIQGLVVWLRLRVNSEKGLS